MILNDKIVIGITGTIGAGKDVVAEYISKKLNVPALQISQPLKDIARELGIKITRENLVELGTKITKERGNDYLAVVLLERAPSIAVFSGMRELAQLQYLRDHARLILIAVDAAAEVRFARAQKRGKIGEAGSLEDFVRHEQEENSPPHTQRLFECMKLAQYHIDNENTLENLYNEVDDILKKENLI